MKEEIGYRVRKRVLQQLPAKRSSNQFVRLFETDWDILVILDACGVRSLRKTASWPVETAISPASCTPEWLRAAGSHSVLDETHIVSGNPQYKKVDIDLGCDTIEPYWESHWNATLQTVLPEPILNRVDRVAEETTEGVVAHLQQPHWPYVAQLGDEWTLAYDELGPWTVGDERITSVQVAMQRGLIDIERAKQAYEASVQSVWNVLTGYLVRWLDQRYTVVVTADHGETFGQLREFGFYEHPCGCQVAPLVNVPWIELTPQESDQPMMNNVEDRLRALGYAE